MQDLLKGELDLDLGRLPYFEFKYDLDWLESIERNRDLEGAGLCDLWVCDFEWCLASSTRFTFLGGTGKDISSKQKHKTVKLYVGRHIVEIVDTYIQKKAFYNN